MATRWGIRLPRRRRSLEMRPGWRLCLPWQVLNGAEMTTLHHRFTGVNGPRLFCPLKRTLA